MGDRGRVRGWLSIALLVNGSGTVNALVPSPQYHDMIAGRPASVLSGGGDDATMYALGVLKWWRVAPRPAFFSLLF